MTNPRKPELMAPAGDWPMLAAAAAHGADAVYFGVDRWSMRKGTHFRRDELADVVAFCRERAVATRLTLNTIVYDEELAEIEATVATARTAGVDMVVAWDPAVLDMCRRHGLPVCVSTQASVANSRSAQWYGRQGARRIVLARECDLDRIRAIRAACPDLEIEVFIHGAMCVAISGRCFLSQHLFGKSANRGACAQPCRREYDIQDRSDPAVALRLGDGYLLSPRDLCGLEMVGPLMDIGVDAFKIEGRKRSPEYVAVVTAAYRQAIDAQAEGQWTEAMGQRLRGELERVFNRGFSPGFYLGQPGPEDRSDRFGSHATTRKVDLGRILNYYARSGIAYAALDGGSLSLGDEVCVIGPTTGAVLGRVESLMANETPAPTARKGDLVTFPFGHRVRAGDRLFLMAPVAGDAAPRSRKEQV